MNQGVLSVVVDHVICSFCFLLFRYLVLHPCRDLTFFYAISTRHTLYSLCFRCIDGNHFIHMPFKSCFKEYRGIDNHEGIAITLFAPFDELIRQDGVNDGVDQGQILFVVKDERSQLLPIKLPLLVEIASEMPR